MIMTFITKFTFSQGLNGGVILGYMFCMASGGVGLGICRGWSLTSGREMRPWLEE